MKYKKGDFVTVRGFGCTYSSHKRAFRALKFNDTESEHPSKNPRRLDDPRQLNNMAMIKYGGKLIGVPMTNIYKCNYGKLFNII